MKAAADRLTLNVRTLYRRIAEGELPQPVKLGRSSRMLEADIEAYLDRLLRQRRRM